MIDENDVYCEHCGGFLTRDMDLPIALSNPPKLPYGCGKCGTVSYIAAEYRAKDFIPIVDIADIDRVD